MSRSKVIALVLVLALLFPGCASIPGPLSQDAQDLGPAAKFAVGGQAFDWASTVVGVCHSNLVEQNPIFGDECLQVAISSAIVKYLFLKGVIYLRKKGEIGDGVLWSIGGVGAAAGLWNSRQIYLVETEDE